MPPRFFEGAGAGLDVSDWPHHEVDLPIQTDLMVWLFCRQVWSYWKGKSGKRQAKRSLDAKSCCNCVRSPTMSSGIMRPV